jgi:hypothetical protein
VCFADAAVRALYPPRKAGRKEGANESEPTQEEVERCVREQLACVPEWWAAAVGDQARYNRPEPLVIQVVRLSLRGRGGVVGSGRLYCR